MIPVSVALQTALDQPAQTIATCWKVTLRNATVYGFTDHDLPLTIDGTTYAAATGYTRSDIATASDLSVDNSEVEGMLVSPAITEADLNAGIWDGARVEMFAVDWSDLTKGELILRKGWLGEVTIGRGTFRAELRGLTQAYTRQIGDLSSPQCLNTLGDARCQVDLTPFTFATTVTDVGADNQTFTAAGLAQPGPTGAVAISAITQADPGIVTTATALGLTAGAPVTIYGCGGMTQANGSTFIRSPSGATFSLGVDTSGYPPYTGGGYVVPLGGSSGYFDAGLVTFTSGANVGLSMDVRSYTPGQVMLQLPMPYPIVAGDAFTIVAGCDKSLNTCKTRFSNVENFRGAPYLPGIDKIIQVGKQQS